MTPLVSAPLADDAPHLLVVDDDRRIRDLLSRFLCGEGYRVTTAMSASDARAKLLGLHFGPAVQVMTADNGDIAVISQRQRGLSRS